MIVCPRCFSFFNGRNWHYDPKKFAPLIDNSDYQKECCPGCERQRNNRIDGIVKVQGNFYKSHRQEVHNLILNVEGKKRNKNIAAKIIRFKPSKDNLTVETTEKTLAERIGKELEKAFSGNLNIAWLEGADFVRVDWRRNN